MEKLFQSLIFKKMEKLFQSLICGGSTRLVVESRMQLWKSAAVKALISLFFSHSNAGVCAYKCSDDDLYKIATLGRCISQLQKLKC